MSARHMVALLGSVLLAAGIVLLWSWAGWRWGRLIALTWVIGIPIGLIFSILAQRRANKRDRLADQRNARADARLARIDAFLTIWAEHWDAPPKTVKRLLQEAAERTREAQP
jgi:MFS family permease